MFTKTIKKLRTGSSYLPILLVLLLLFLSSGHDLFHNHKPDLEHHHDCPAFQIVLSFSSIIVYYFIICFILSVCAFFPFVRQNVEYTSPRSDYHPRAPPF